MGGVHSSGCRGDDHRTVSVWMGSLFGETDCTGQLNNMNVHMYVVRNYGWTGVTCDLLSMYYYCNLKIINCLIIIIVIILSILVIHVLYIEHVYMLVHVQYMHCIILKN